MRKRLAALCALLLLLTCAGCKKTPEPQNPAGPGQAQDEPSATPAGEALSWIVKPQHMYQDVVALEYYDEPGAPQAQYIAFMENNMWGLLNADFEVIIDPVNQLPPVFCQMGELHLYAPGSNVEDIEVRADDITVTQDGHGYSVQDLVYNVEDQSVYIGSGDTGMFYFPLAEYPGELNAIEPVAYVKLVHNEFMELVAEPQGAYGYCDSSGKMLTGPDYEYADAFSEGRAAVRRDGLWGYIDERFQPVTEFAYHACFGTRYFDSEPSDSPYYPYRFVGGYAVVRGSGGYGVINTEGKLVVPCEFQKLVPLPGGRFAARHGNQWGLGAVPDKAQ